MSIQTSEATKSAQNAARKGDGKFGIQPLVDVSADVKLYPDFVEPPTVTIGADEINPGDQVMRRDGAMWCEVGTKVHVTARPGLDSSHVLRCVDGYQKRVMDGEAVEVIRADENGIPAISSTIHAAVMNKPYDSGTPEYVDWCDGCGEHAGFSVANDRPDGHNEICHGCEDRKIADYEPPTWGSDESSSYVNEHGVDMTPGQTPTAGAL